MLAIFESLFFKSYTSLSDAASGPAPLPSEEGGEKCVE